MRMSSFYIDKLETTATGKLNLELADTEVCNQVKGKPVSTFFNHHHHHHHRHHLFALFT